MAALERLVGWGISCRIDSIDRGRMMDALIRHSDLDLVCLLSWYCNPVKAAVYRDSTGHPHLLLVLHREVKGSWFRIRADFMKLENSRIVAKTVIFLDHRIHAIE